jgi:hypothetical protein
MCIPPTHRQLPKGNNNTTILEYSDQIYSNGERIPKSIPIIAKVSFYVQYVKNEGLEFVVPFHVRFKNIQMYQEMRGKNFADVKRFVNRCLPRDWKHNGCFELHEGVHEKDNQDIFDVMDIIHIDFAMITDKTGFRPKKQPLVVGTKNLYAITKKVDVYQFRECIATQLIPSDSENDEEDEDGTEIFDTRGIKIKK